MLRALLLLVALWPVAAGANQTPDIVEIMEVSGVIDSATVAQVVRQVEAINENPKVKAVVLVMDSPGGGAVASAALYEELGKARVPVVGWCNSVCASGAIYALMAPTVKYIYVRRETISGSVGVIAQVARFHELLKWAKVEVETYRSGDLKDAGNATRPREEREKEYLEGIIKELAERFYGVVAKSRRITDWKQVKTGRIFIGDEAVKIGLVDAVGDRAQAIKKAKELSGSAVIFTRDELKKMSKAAEAGGAYFVAPKPEQGDWPWLIELLKEIRRGESITFEYRMPYRF